MGAALTTGCSPTQIAEQTTSPHPPTPLTTTGKHTKRPRLQTNIPPLPQGKSLPRTPMWGEGDTPNLPHHPNHTAQDEKIHPPRSPRSLPSQSPGIISASAENGGELFRLDLQRPKNPLKRTLGNFLAPKNHNGGQYATVWHGPII